MSITKEAIRDNMVQAFEKLSNSYSGVAFKRTDRNTRYESHFPNGMLNRVFTYTRSDEVDPIAEIKSIASLYHERGFKCSWLTYSHDQDELTDQALVANKFEKVGSMSGMSLLLEGWSYNNSDIPGLEIRAIRSPHEYDLFNRVLLSGFNIPDTVAEAFTRVFVDLGPDNAESFQHYLAFIDGEPACTLTTFLEDEVAGIYTITTVESFRKRGIGGALTTHALREVQAKGAKLAILQASAMGQSIYQRLGFKIEMTINIYSG